MPSMGDFVPELLCMGVDLSICIVLYKVYQSTNNLLKDLTTAPQIPIDEHLGSRISNHPSCLTSEEGAVSCLPFAVVRGDVAPMGRTVSSAYSSAVMNGVIQKVVFTEHKRNMSKTGFWVDSERVLHQYTNDAPFCLASPQDSIFSLMRPHVEVIDWKDAARIDLDTVYDQFESAPGGIGNHIWGWVLGDLHKGVQKTEMMLTKDTTLTGIGELVAGPEGVRLQPPSDGRNFYLVRSSLASLVKEIESGRTVLKVGLYMFVGVGVFISGLAAWKFYKKVKEERNLRGNQESLEGIRSEREARRVIRSGNMDQVPESVQCVVCLGAEREVILLNCGHVCVCADCAGELLRAGHHCPVCRAVIERVMPAYVS